MTDVRIEAKKIIDEFREEGTDHLKPGPHQIHAVRLMTLVEAGEKHTKTNKEVDQGYESAVEVGAETFFCITKHPIQFN